MGGVGPCGKSLRDRVGVERIERKSLELLIKEITLLQQERSLARALAQMKRRESTPKLPRPRRHKHHCMCRETPPLENTPCCRCAGLKCVKRPKAKREKRI
jgi:hypothetical protein